MSGKRKYQFSKSTSSKKTIRKRDISYSLPYSEFPATTGTFTGLVVSILIGLFGAVNTYAASSISITLSGDVELNLARSNDEAVYGKSSEQTAHVESDHFTGYTFTIAGQDDEGSLVGENNPANKITSINTEMTEGIFKTTANNQWGFLPDTLRKNETTITNNNYQPAPKTTPTEIDKTTSPNKTDGGKDYKLAIGARVDSTMSLDSYGQTFILAATGNGYDYHIGFTDNMTNLPDDIYGHEDTASVNLPSETPTKDGFVFGGWCAQPTTADPVNGTTCPSSVKVYQPGEQVDLVATDANNMLLYAIWTKGYNTFADAFAGAGKTDSDKTNGYFRMQDITPEICNSIVIGSPSLETEAGINANTLIDTRNNKTYLVAKYADGHCWMRENLNLLMTAGSGIEAYNFETKSIFTYTPEQYGTTQTDTGTAWRSDASDGARSFARDENKFIGGTNIATAGTIMDTGQPYEHIGVLYNWAAATAQTGEQAAAAGSSGEQVIPTSICPKGWRLPANSGDYSFSTLMGSYGLPTTNQDGQGYSGQLQNPLNFNRPGYYGWSNGVLGGRGTNGRFWSSVGYSTASAHSLGFLSTYFNPQAGYGKGNGFSVRCVAV
ncbi:hypothetical protein IKE72_00060 [Candidatus Saccharibacteria bacterium]|nr:hypothetical protein [Candidatus Saccharibacteria bacterium]